MTYGAATAAFGFLFNDLHLRIGKKILYSQQRTWLSSADMLCYYRVEQRDLAQEVLSIKLGDDNFKTLFPLDHGKFTEWYFLRSFSERPLRRYMTNVGYTVECPCAGPNFKGAIPSFFP